MAAEGGTAANTVPDPEHLSLRRPPTMLTTDIALRVDPVYEQSSRRFLEHPEEFANAFAARAPRPSGPPGTPVMTRRCPSRPAAPAQDQTDVESLAALEPTSDGFRSCRGNGHRLPPANHRQAPLGVLTSRLGSLNNDIFVRVLDMGTA